MSIVVFAFIVVCVLFYFVFEAIPVKSKLSSKMLTWISMQVFALYLVGIMLAFYAAEYPKPLGLWYAKMTLMGICVLTIGLIRYEVRYYKTIKGEKIRSESGGYDLGRVGFIIHQAGLVLLLICLIWQLHSIFHIRGF